MYHAYISLAFLHFISCVDDLLKVHPGKDTAGTDFLKP